MQLFGRSDIAGAEGSSVQNFARKDQSAQVGLRILPPKMSACLCLYPLVCIYFHPCY